MRSTHARGLVVPSQQLHIERFDYFRHVVRRRKGGEPPELMLGLQDRFDTHFLDSPAWQRARGTG